MKLDDAFSNKTMFVEYLRECRLKSTKRANCFTTVLRCLIPFLSQQTLRFHHQDHRHQEEELPPATLEGNRSNVLCSKK